MTALAILYGILSLIEKFGGPGSVLPSTGGIYSHWTVVTLTFMACANLLFATVRLPVKWDRAGAWCSHLGLMFLVVGSMSFWMTRTEGQCFISRLPNGSWPVMRSFFRSTDKVAIYVSPSQMITPGHSKRTEFDSVGGLEPVDIEVSVDGTPPDVTITADRIYPRANLRDQWSNDEVGISPAIEVQFSYGHQSGRTIMCEAYEDTSRYELPDCIFLFKATEAIPQDRIDQMNASLEPADRPSPEVFSIHYIGSGQPVLVTRDSSGRLSRREFGPGQSFSSSNPRQPLQVKLLSTMNRARRGASLEVPPDDFLGRTDAAIEVTVKSGSWKAKRVLPFQSYLTGRPTTITTPSGRQFYITFSHSYVDLPKPIRITRHEFKTAPASTMPEDYICDIEIGSGVQVTKETLKLNFPVKVGKYRLHQST